MKQGTTPTLQFTIKNASGEAIDNTGMTLLTIVFKKTKWFEDDEILSKTYPPDISYSSSSKLFSFELTAEETRLFEVGTAYYEITINYEDGSIAKTGIGSIQVEASLS